MTVWKPLAVIAALFGVAAVGVQWWQVEVRTKPGEWALTSQLPGQPAGAGSMCWKGYDRLSWQAARIAGLPLETAGASCRIEGKAEVRGSSKVICQLDGKEMRAELHWQNVAAEAWVADVSLSASYMSVRPHYRIEARRVGECKA